MSRLLNETWVRGILTAAVVAGVARVVLVISDRNEPAILDCNHAVLDADDGIAASVCQREYERTGDPSTGAKLANALRRKEKRPAATELATRLLSTSARADALQVLGKIAITERHLEVARDRLENARALHLATFRMRQLAVDDQALATLFTAQERFAEALRALDHCILESRQANEHLIEGYCRMTAGAVLGRVGYLTGAYDELTRASSFLDRARDLAELEATWGGLDQRDGFGPPSLARHAQAVSQFEQAIAHATAASLTRVTRKAELNLVFSLAELGRTDEAAQHLKIASVLDVDNIDDKEREQLEARIAYRRGDLPRATTINARAYDRLAPEERNNDFILRLCIMQAQIGVATKDLDAITRWATRGIAIAEATRLEQSALELRPWMLSVRREPYEILFAALARAGRFEDALVVFDGWQGRTLLDAMARARSTQPVSLRAAASHTEALERLLPSLSSAPLMKPAERDVLLASLRRVDLIVLLVANEEIWRVTARHGKLAMDNLGRLEDWRSQLDQFATTPTRTELAERLGELLLGDATFRDTPETLYVLLDGQLTQLPIVALRKGRPLIAMRPVVRAARLSELSCTTRPERSLRATVLADAAGNLPQARREAELTARRFGVNATLGPAATRDALFASSHDDVLDVAVHAGVELGGGTLAMSDRPVSALEIAAQPGWPAMVVLSACSSAAADDGELATSLATAFLASGSVQVVATLRPIKDRGASELTHAFYDAGGATDPARALARVQADLAKTTNDDWPNFVLFGHDICRKDLK
ncbi:MAG: CHAT domain-containing protein [Kofleriaceae bacterium]